MGSPGAPGGLWGSLWVPVGSLGGSLGVPGDPWGVHGGPWGFLAGPWVVPGWSLGSLGALWVVPGDLSVVPGGLWAPWVVPGGPWVVPGWPLGGPWVVPGWSWGLKERTQSAKVCRRAPANYCVVGNRYYCKPTNYCKYYCQTIAMETQLLHMFIGKNHKNKPTSRKLNYCTFFILLRNYCVEK